MFFLLLLSVFQICFIPGFIALHFINNKWGNSETLLMTPFAFGLSLIINYFIAFLLSYFHIYTRSSIIFLLIIELIVLALIYLTNFLRTSRFSFNHFLIEIKTSFYSFFKSVHSPYDIIRIILLILSGILLFSILIMLLLNIGKIFSSWDAVFSWNRWAQEFCRNEIPTNTYHYPLLIPANWSIAYLLYGFPLQFIARGIMPLFLFFLVYTFIIIGLKQKSNIFFVAALFLYPVMNRLNWTDGCVDVPVAFFAVMVLISLILISNEDEERQKYKYIILGLTFACGSAVTKQAGLYMLIIFPLLLYILTKNNFEWPSKRILKYSLLSLLFLLLIVVPFYLKAEIDIKNRLNTSEINYVTNEIYRGATYPERFKNALMLFSDIFRSKLLLLLSITGFILSFSSKSYRSINFIMVIPYFVIWAIFFSYDLRNSAIMIPYLCIAIGAGLEMAFLRTKENINKD